MKLLFAALAITTALSGCAVGGVRQAFTAEQVASIKPGITVAQVSGMQGSP